MAFVSVFGGFGTPWGGGVGWAGGTYVGDVNANMLLGSPGRDWIFGAAGNDSIVGGHGGDMLIGGADADRFVYLSALDSTPWETDTVLDFEQGLDKFDVSALVGQFGLEWTGTTPTTGGVWHMKLAGLTYIFIDTENNPAAPGMIIRVNGRHDLTAADFIGFNIPPILSGDLNGQPLLEGGSYVLTLTDLNWVDPDDVAANIFFTASAPVNGKVQVDNGSGFVDDSTFTGADLAAGKVRFLHDGSETVTAQFNIMVEDENEDLSDPLYTPGATGQVTFAVTPVNDPPVITSDGGGTVASISLPENQAAVTTVVATDVDLPGDTLTYAISGGVDSARFQINSSTGALSFITAPDYETPLDVGSDNTYAVQVTVSDGNGGTDVQDITVTVGNVAEPPVIFSNGGGDTTNFSITENTAAATTVQASDQDAGTTLIYSITGGADSALFQINSSTGALDFITAPDYETPLDAGSNNGYEVQVSVTDGGLTDSQLITVFVTNENEAPEITSDGAGTTALVTMDEDTTTVTTVTSDDEDVGDDPTYTITGGADSALFQIDSFTGVLSFITAPDYELPQDAGSDNDYEVQVTVTDEGGLTDVQDITVRVEDVFDNTPPAITSGGALSATDVNVNENQTAVMTVAASDTDLPAQTLTYSISGGADSARFQIDSSTGALSFITAPDFETPNDVSVPAANNVYLVQVKVADPYGGEDVQDISVVVQDVNDDPVITSDGGGSTAAISINENTTTVTTVTATDQDTLPAPDTLTYSITGGADSARFQINSSTGALSFITAPDYENPLDSGGDNFYDVVVTVSDGQGGTDSQAITVAVANQTEAVAVADSVIYNASTSTTTVTIPAFALFFNDTTPNGTASGWTLNNVTPLTGSGSYALVSGNATASGFSTGGSGTFSYTYNDGVSTSPSAIVTTTRVDSTNYSGTAGNDIIITNPGINETVNSLAGTDVIVLQAGGGDDNVVLAAATAGVDHIFGFAPGGDNINLPTGDTTEANTGTSSFSTNSVTEVANGANFDPGDTNDTDVFELIDANNANGDLSLATDGTELLKLLCSASGGAAAGLTTDTSGDEFFVVAYDNGNAYIYHADAGGNSLVTAAEIRLLGVLYNITEGALSAGDFIMV